MAVWDSSSLAFSDHNNMRHERGLLKHTKDRVSKQHLVESKMFGSKRKNIRMGKMFKKKGKGVGNKTPISAHMENKGGISPSIEDFDKMMKSITKGSSKSGR